MPFSPSRSVSLIAKSILAALATSVIFTAGCGVGTMASAGASPGGTPNPVHGAAIHGMAYGGQQPIAGGAIQLWAVGNTGYASAATPLLNASASTGTGTGASAVVNSWAITGPAGSTIATFQTATNTLTSGEAVALSGFTTGSFFNGQTVTVLSTGLTSTTFEAYFNHADATGVADTGLVTDAAAGAFSITENYTCPSANSLIYLTIAGGNAGGGSNTAIELMTPLGICSNLGSGTFIMVNEVTTVAAAYALGNYFSFFDGFSIGAPNTPQAQQGLLNAFSTVNTLVNTTNGIANTSVTYGGTPPTVTITPTNGGSGAMAKATIANNGVVYITVTAAGTGYNAAPTIAITGGGGSGATATATLSGTTVGSITVTAPGSNYNAATVTATPEATKLNTLANIISACVNSGTTNFPSGTCATLENNVAGTQASNTMEAAVDMALHPIAGSNSNLTALYGLQNGFSPYQNDLGSQPTDLTLGILYTDTTTSLIDPQLAVPDSQGNIYVMNHNSTTSASVTELSPIGIPLSNTSTIGGTTFSGLSPRGMAIDQNDNAWIATSGTGSSIFEYNPATELFVRYGDPVTFSPYAPAFDASNNLFIGKGSASDTTAFDELVGANPASTSLVEWPNPSFTAQPEVAAVDTSGNVYATNTSASGETTYFEVMTNYSTSGCNTPYPCTSGNTETYVQDTSSTGNVPALAEPWGLAAGPNGEMWVANNGSGGLMTLMTSPTAGADFGSSTSLNKPESLAVDGAGNVWTGSFLASPGTIEELNYAGTPLSQVSGGASPFTVVGYSRATIADNTGIAVDPSGNVWTASNTTMTGNGLFELVGAGAPTVTPIARALEGSPIVTITGGGGSGATAWAQAAGGKVVAITMLTPGTGYTSTPTTTITSSGSLGSGAMATANISSGGVINFTVNSGGSGYTGVASEP